MILYFFSPHNTISKEDMKNIHLINYVLHIFVFIS